MQRLSDTAIEIINDLHTERLEYSSEYIKPGPAGPERRQTMDNLKPCSMCVNAKVDDELNSDRDLSYFEVGRCKHGFRILLGSGGGAPVRLIFERHNGDSWNTVGIYFPSHCPNCGRELFEYEKEDPNEEADLCG